MSYVQEAYRVTIGRHICTGWPQDVTSLQVMSYLYNWVERQVCATHCNALQHTTTHCNTLQHTRSSDRCLRHPVRFLCVLSFVTIFCKVTPPPYLLLYTPEAYRVTPPPYLLPYKQEANRVTPPPCSLLVCEI